LALVALVVPPEARARMAGQAPSGALLSRLAALVEPATPLLLAAPEAQEVLAITAGLADRTTVASTALVAQGGQRDQTAQAAMAGLA
jgi:hypothetical protein